MKTPFINRIERVMQVTLLAMSILYSLIVSGQNQCDITISSSVKSGGGFVGTTFVPAASSANIHIDTLINLLRLGNVTINTSFGGGTGSGNITLNNAIVSAKTATTPTTFTMIAGGTITLNAAIDLQPQDQILTNTGRNATAINFTAVSDITVTGAISTIGGKSGSLGTGGSGGSISLTSTSGSIVINGDINASGGNAGLVALVVGSGANITITAASGITLTQDLISNYGANGLLGSALKGDISFTNGSTTVTSAGSNDGQTSGSIISAKNLTKSGNGTLMLAGTNTYDGTTTINAGKLGASDNVIASTDGPFGDHSSGLILNGGTVMSNTAIFSRDITVSANGSGIDAFGSARTITSAITGTGAFSLNVGGTTAANADGQPLTLSGIISSSPNGLSVTKIGSSTVTLPNANTFTGGTTLAAGTLIAGNAQAFGTAAGTFTIAGGTLDASSSITTVDYPLALNGNFTFTGTSNLNLGTGTITMNGDRQITITANTLTLGGAISQATRSLTKTGSGILHLGTFAKSINSLTISGGTITSTSNTLTLAGNFTNAGTFSHNSGTVTYSATGGGQTIGAVTYSNLILSNTSSTNSLGGSATIEGVLTMTSGGNLSLGTNTLTLNGTISGMSSTSRFTANGTSSIIIGDSGALGANLFFDQTIPGTTNRISNFTYNRSGATITLGDNLEIAGTLTPTLGQLATADKLKLVSTASATGRVAAGTVPYISGTVTVERFVPATARRWRFIGSPVSNVTLADLKNEIFITGTGGAANGFDASANNQASVYGYDEMLTSGDLNTGFVAATNITNPLTVGKGYRIFIRGDRSDPGRLTGTVANQNAVTLNLVGALNTGDITIPVSFSSSGNVVNDGWNFVGNPYASAYDWKAFWNAKAGSANCTNIDPTIYIFDATSNSYTSYNASSNTGTLSDGIIPAFAGFWVKATTTSPALILTETYKTASAPINLFKTNEGEGFKIRLEADSISYDEMVIKYMAGASVNKDSLDIFKLASTLVNICAYGTDTQYLTASVRPLTTTTDTIRLGVYATVAGNYTLRFYNSTQIAILENVLLYDTYTNTVTDLTVTTQYPFAVVSGVAASQGDSRFYIVVTNNTGLPVNILSFDAQKQNDQTVKLNWATTQELQNDHFEIEHSTDGRFYAKMGDIKGNGSSHKPLQYTFTDHHPTTENYYRLKQVDVNGAFKYSQTVHISLEIAKVLLELFPVPALNELSIKQSQPIETVRIFDLSGSLKFVKPIHHTTATLDIQPLDAGMYMIEIESTTGETVRTKFVKQ